MRSFVGFLFFLTVLVALAAAFLVPAVVAPWVASAVRDASPFGDQPIDVEVDMDAIGLIRGTVGEIRISGRDLERDGVRIASLAVSVHDVGIGDHEFRAVDGGLESILIPLGDPGAAPDLEITRIDLSGPSEAIVAEVRLDQPAALTFVTRSFADQGVDVTDMELINGALSFVIFGERVQVALEVIDGSLAIADILGAGQLDLLVPQPDDPWRLAGVTVTSSGMVLDASVDADRILAGR
jgi:hypothetical protein